MKCSSRKLTAKEITGCAAAYGLIMAAAGWLFYDQVLAALVFVPFFFFFVKAAGRIKTKRYNEVLTEGFMQSLISVATSLQASLSPENAFYIAASDMEKLYGPKGPVVTELNLVCNRIRVGGRIEDALYDLADRTGIPEIYDFAVVFSVAKERGGNYSEVISSCVSVIRTNRRTELEARILIRSKQYEQRIMCLIPPGILVYLRLSSAGFMDVLYHNLLGISVMTICLLTYVFAILISEKIGELKI